MYLGMNFLSIAMISYALSLNNTLHDHITKRPTIHHRPNRRIKHRIPIHTAPVQRKAIMERHTPYQLTDASAVAFTERVNDIQFGHDIGQMLDLAFPVRFVQHLLAVQQTPCPTPDRSDAVERTAFRPC